MVDFVNAVKTGFDGVQGFLDEGNGQPFGSLDEWMAFVKKNKPHKNCNFALVISPPPILRDYVSGDTGGQYDEVTQLRQNNTASTGISKQLHFTCEDMEIAGKSLITDEHTKRGIPILMPYGVAFQPVNLTFRSSEDFTEYQFCRCVHVYP